MKNKIITFVKKETVLTIAWLLAFISMFFVTPSADYISYIDFKSLGILWSLMVIMAGLQKIGLFKKIGQKLYKRAKNIHQLSLILIFLCFFSSMFTTNDVSLITFVPFAIYMLEEVNRKDLFIPVITFQTIAANLGSMLTPIGNPQNLYLYGLSGMDIQSFILLMLPYTAITCILLIISSFLVKNKSAALSVPEAISEESIAKLPLIVYLVLFILALLVVARLVPFYILVICVLVAVFFTDKKTITSIDYALLFTFIGFFIFTGNLGKIKTISTWLTNLVNGKEVIVGVISSQFISNVPAALLLSDFTDNIKNLIIGVNFGGLGTLIASMASLISFKFLAHTHNEYKGKYLLYFTISNIIYLCILLLAYVIINPML